MERIVDGVELGLAREDFVDEGVTGGSLGELDRNESKNAGDSDGWCVVRRRVGGPSAFASEEDDDDIPGGGGVG